MTAGENPILAIAEGGTGADNATSALSNLGILGAIVNASVKGKTITFTKKDNTKFSINTQDTNNGIVAALLKQNGYIKFANGLILQWGYYPGEKSHTIKFPLAFNVIFAVTHSTINSGTIIMNIGIDSVTKTQFKTYDAVKNNQYDCPIYWIAIGF